MRPWAQSLVKKTFDKKKRRKEVNQSVGVELKKNEREKLLTEIQVKVKRILKFVNFFFFFFSTFC